MSKILIIGGAGFIGFALAKRLSKNLNNKIVIIDSLSRGRLDNELIKISKNKNVKFLKKDLTKKFNLNVYDFDYIFQFAAVVGVRNVYSKPYYVLDANVKIQSNVIDFANKQKKLKKIIFTSTSEVFIGTLEKKKLKFPTPENETIILNKLSNPRSTYMLSKIYCENLLIHSGLNYLILRPHNIFGPRMGYDHVIPELINRFLKLKKNENNLLLENPNHKRAFCYIDDAINQILLLYKSKKASFKIINVGSFEEKKILELAKGILKKMKKNNIKIEKKNIKNRSPLRRLPDLTKNILLTKLIKRTDFYESLNKTIDWYKKNYEQKKN